MSHYYTIVLVSKGTEDIEGKVKQLLAPYDENLEVPEYRDDCACVGSLARRDVWERVDSEFGTADELRRKFHDTAPDDGSSPERWDAFIAPVVAAGQDMLKDHPLRDAPDPDCPECVGTGIILTTYNPESKWDWWQVGGRWTGILRPGYDPETDPAHFERCYRCGGRGIEPSDDERRKSEDKAVFAAPCRQVGSEERQKEPPCDIDAGPIHPEAVCRQCDGTGRVLGFPGNWRCDDDVAPAMRLLSLLDQDIERHCPHAVVTPDGAWHEQGRMGWFGSVFDEKPKDEWQWQVVKIAEDHADCVAVVCDLHI